MWPRPRPEIIGTAPPHAARIGASISETLSPTPPVECLSSTGRSRSHSQDGARARHRRGERDALVGSRGRAGRAPSRSAPTWASESAPSVIPPTRNCDLLRRQRLAVALAADDLGGEHSFGQLPAERDDQAGEVAAPPRWRTRSVCSCDSASPPMPSARLVIAETAATRRPAVAGEDHLGDGRHADGVGAERAERADLGRGLEARAGGGEVDALGELDAERVGGGAADARAAPGRRRRAGSGSAARPRRRWGR